MTTASPPPLPWAHWKVGQRVVVRYEDTDGSTRDALGTLTENAIDYVVIEARRGTVRVAASQMIVGRVVGPPRPRRSDVSPPHTRDLSQG